jgi:iron complex outermembrane recepter protein
MVVGMFLLLGFGQPGSTAADEKRYFKIPRDNARITLQAYARQASYQVLYPYDVVAEYTTNAVEGWYQPDTALTLLLDDTGLEATSDREGRLTIRTVAENNESREHFMTEERTKSNTQNRKKSLASMIAAAIVSVFGTAELVNAQDETSAGGARVARTPGVIDEVVVTAQRREQSLSDVPISLSVVSGEALEGTGTNTLGDVAQRMPNVYIAQVPGSDFMTIRGIGSGNNLGFEQAVATFVDGNYRSRSRASRFAFLDVERVEILRGPQTTFFGNNAIAGALNITTRRPGSEPEFNISGLYAPSDGEYNLNGGVSVPVTETFAVRLAGQFSGMEGYIDNLRDDSEGPDKENTSGRVSFVWTPAEWLEFDGRLDVGKSDDTGIYYSEVKDCPPSAPFTLRGACARHVAASGEDRLDYKTYTGPGFFDMDMTEVVLETTVSFENHDLKFLTGYYEHEYQQMQDVMPSINASAVETISGLPTGTHEETDQFSQEIRLQSTGDGGLDYLVGLYYSESDLTIEQDSGFYFTDFGGLPIPPFNSFTSILPGDPVAGFFDNTQEDEVISPFAAFTYHVSDTLRANFGVRYSKVKKRVSRTAVVGVSDQELSSIVPASAREQAIMFAVLGFAPGEFADPERTDEEFMPSLGVELDLTQDTMVYGTYTKGFKAGGYSVGLQKDSFEPETVDAYEIGLKTSQLDNRLQFHLAAYYSDYQDLQENSFVLSEGGVPVGVIGNSASSVAKGIEAGGAFQATDQIQLTFDFAYLSSEYEDFELGPCTAAQSAVTPNCVADLSGSTRSYSPEFSGNVGLTYLGSITDTIDLRWDLNVYYTSDFYTTANAEPLSEQEAYTKFDSRLAILPAAGNWEIALIGKNLSDKTTFGYWSPLPSSPGSGQVVGDRPRSVALQMSYKY